MNRKGITLIELLAVITVMGIVLLIVIPNILVMSKKSNEQYYEQTKTILEEATMTYIEHNGGMGLNKIGDKTEIFLDDLANAKLVDKPIVNPITKEEILGTAIIKITKVDENEYEIELPL